ncbi:hypothetical protein [Actinoplanes teichomyceticus]|uniref:hypothetical protein n=1 Tax=Actinoplanes teichomyceticus TaxID=1867 RepID=UPI001EF25984|nr:hypothetical protein [Actinoplanes teichomyceticus]
MNLLLGVPAMIPIHLTWYIVANGPLAELGWTEQSWTWNPNDGLLPLVTMATVLFVLFGSIWVGVNAYMRYRTAVPATRYWLACSVATLAPLCIDAVR